MSEQNPFIVPGGSSDQAGDSFDTSGRNVDVGRGLEWPKQGWQLFVKSGFTREPMMQWPQQWPMLLAGCLSQPA